MKTQSSPVGTVNGKTIGALLIGIISMLGLIILEKGAILSIVGLLLAVLGFKEAKQMNQTGRKLAVLGAVINLGCIISLIVSQ